MLQCYLLLGSKLLGFWECCCIPSVLRLLGSTSTAAVKINGVHGNHSFQNVAVLWFSVTYSSNDYSIRVLYIDDNPRNVIFADSSVYEADKRVNKKDTHVYRDDNGAFV